MDIIFPRFAHTPFYSGGGSASLVAQMINFVEDLPLEWRSIWERLRSGENNSINIGQWKDSFGFLNLLPWFPLIEMVEMIRLIVQQPRRG
jgi:hypothetical protein